MKVLVAGVSFSSEISGIQRHAFNLVRCLLSCSEISKVGLVIGPWQQRVTSEFSLTDSDRLSIHVTQSGRGSLSRNLWHYRELPALANQFGADIVYLTYPVPCNRSSFRCPVVVTLHDLYPYEIPRNFGFPHVIFNRVILKYCLNNVDAIACVSAITKYRLAEYFSPDVCRKAVHISNVVENPIHTSGNEAFAAFAGKAFLLCVAQHRRNKNVPLLVRSFHHLLQSGGISPDLNLLIVGIPGPETNGIRRLIHERNLEGKVHLLEGLSEQEIQYCYKYCEALVTPSLTEGFGLPVAEGMLAGCRIICSDIPAFREIGEGYCRFVKVDEDSETELAEAIGDTLKGPRKSPVSLPQFSIEVLAKKYLKLFSDLLTASDVEPLAASAHSTVQEKHS